MLGLIVSTVVYFVASHYTGRWLDGMDIPKSLTRSASVFSFSVLLAYGSAAIVDWLMP
jgi:hypothetical protein